LRINAGHVGKLGEECIAADTIAVMAVAIFTVDFLSEKSLPRNRPQRRRYRARDCR